MNTTMRKTCSLFVIIIWHLFLLGAMTVLAMFASIPLIYAQAIPNGKFAVTLNIAGAGTVTLDPPGGIYTPNTTIKLIATPAPGYVFSGYSGDFKGWMTVETMKIDDKKNLTATFSKLPSPRYPVGIWTSAAEINVLPISGLSWEQLKREADAPLSPPNLSDNEDDSNVAVLAKALVYARTGEEKYRQGVIAACMAAIGTEQGGRTLALGRELMAYVLAADLVGLPPTEEATFRNWLRQMLTLNLSGQSLRSTHERRPNNWGTHCGATRAAIARYLGDATELERTARIFKGWLGDRNTYAEFSYGNLDWQADQNAPVGINPLGATIQGRSVDGVLPDDQRRGGGFIWPPQKVNYVYGALQGALMQATILYRAGYDVWNWENQALLRAFNWLHNEASYPAHGDDEWLSHIINYYYKKNFPAAIPAKPGKNAGWTDWLYGSHLAFIVNAGWDKKIVAGRSAQIGGSPTASGGATPYSYAWSPSTGLDNPNAANPNASPASTMAYTVQVTDANGVKASDQVIVTVNPLPTATVTGAASICAGESAAISAALTGAAPWNITWSDGFTQNGILSSPAMRNVSPSSTTIYTVTAITDANDAGTSSGSATVTIKPTPTATVSGSTTVYAGNLATISTALTGAAPWSITWSDGVTQNGIMSSPATRDVWPSSTITYTVTAISDANCAGSSSGSATVSVNTLPGVLINGDNPITAGTTHTYSTSTNVANPNYVWRVVGGTINDGTTQNLTGQAGGTIEVTAGDAGMMEVSVIVTDGVTGNSYNDTKYVTVMTAHTLVADAGPDRDVLFGLTTVLGGNPTASGGDATFSYSWSPASGLDDPTAANPKAHVVPAAGVSTITYTVTVTDNSGNTASDEVTINVQSYVLLCNGYLKINRNQFSEGDVHSNSKLEFQAGAPGTHIGNLTAKDDLTIRTQNTIQGNAIAGDDLYLFDAAVTGATQEHANVEAISLPSFSFSAGGPNVTVPASASQTLAPGSYGTVAVKSDGTLFLSAGDYYMNVFKNGLNAILSINASDGPVNIYVVSDLQFAAGAQVKLTGGSSDSVLFVSLQKPKLVVGANATLYGTLVAPKAQVHFSDDSKIKGAVYASSLSIDPMVKFYHHTSPSVFLKTASVIESKAGETASENLAVSNYQLEQNYPNPFSQIPRLGGGNPSTMIRFTLPEASRTTVAVYSLTGRLVRELVNREMAAGKHAVSWNGQDQAGNIVAAGTYFYRLVVHGANGEAVFTQTRRMALLK